MSLSLHLKSTLATTLTNIDGSHTRSVSHHKRVEGWTEVFGNHSFRTLKSSSNNNQEEEEKKVDFGYDWRLDDLYVYK